MIKQGKGKGDEGDRLVGTGCLLTDLMVGLFISLPV